MIDAIDVQNPIVITPETVAASFDRIARLGKIEPRMLLDRTDRGFETFASSQIAGMRPVF